MIHKRRSFITGINGYKLSNKEIKFLKKYKPWGIIIFSRNIKSIDQTVSLITNIKRIFNDKYYPILIDEEGGNVSRLKKFIDSSIFSSKFFGDLFIKDNKKFNFYSNVYVKQTSYLLNLLGVNINTVPVLDVKRSITSNVIGTRSFSTNPQIVSKLGAIFIKKFHQNSIACVSKHIPGHGLAKFDSHKKLSIVKHKLNYLKKNDFFPFKNQNSLLAMTAHIVYSSIDSTNTATHSSKVIKLIRNKIGFKGILISDDISMKSLKFGLKKNTTKAFNAGCNIVLHCNGNYKEMLIVANNSPLLSNFLIKKTSQLVNIIR